jgi:aspartyl-tRNA(Asn)/glutamyl-tRNA(Gln) amidotransferase subunit C
MSISREDVLRVAELAYLELKPEEVETYRGQLDEILNYIGKLQQLDVTNVEPFTDISFPASEARAASPSSYQKSGKELREDVVGPCQVAEAILDQAADAVKPFFRVPKVIER